MPWARQRHANLASATSCRGNEKVRSVTRTHLLSDVFSQEDLRRLREGKCPVSGRKADPDIAWMLTKTGSHPNDYVLSLAKWWRWWVRPHTKEGEGTEEFRKRLRSDVRNRQRFFQTAGELMAAYFLEEQQGCHLERVPTGEGKRTPDFRIAKGDITVTVEVKTLVGGIPPEVTRYMGAFPGGAPDIRKAVEAARRQLDLATRNLVIIADEWRPGMSRHHVIAAVYGDLELCHLLGPAGPVGDWFEVREKNVRWQPKLNTRVGAICMLRWSGSPACKAYFVHNAHARNPLPPCLFDPWPQLVPREDKRTGIWRNRPDWMQ